MKGVHHFGGGWYLTGGNLSLGVVLHLGGILFGERDYLTCEGKGVRYFSWGVRHRRGTSPAGVGGAYFQLGGYVIEVVRHRPAGSTLPILKGVRYLKQSTSLGGTET